MILFTGVRVCCKQWIIFMTEFGFFTMLLIYDLMIITFPYCHKKIFNTTIMTVSRKNYFF